MVMLVTLAEAKERLRVDGTDDDSQIELLIGSASAAVLNYLKPVGYAGFYDGTTVSTVPDNVKVAVLLTVSSLFDAPMKGEGQHYPGQGRLLPSVEAMLYPMRDPTVA